MEFSWPVGEVTIDRQYVIRAWNWNFQIPFAIYNKAVAWLYVAKPKLMLTNNQHSP